MHYPWCVRKCPYCDFNSHPLRDDSDYHTYTDALIADASFAAQRLISTGSIRPLRSIFFGGGTPSLCPPAELKRILSCLESLFGFARNIEITLEANPGTVDETHFRGFRRAGVNRLSIGVQSFNNEALKQLGRIHDAKRAQLAIQAARRSDFDNINIDLMHSLPGQTAEGALADIEQALHFTPEHLSWYELTLEPNTEFARHPPELPEEDVLSAIEKSGRRALMQAGFQNYEISAWAQPRRRAQHNLNYWRYGDFIGIGAGAHEKISTKEGHVIRAVRQRAPARYIREAGQAAALSQDRVLEEKDRVAEFLLNSFRLREGFTQRRFRERANASPQSIAAGMEEAHQLGLVQCHGERIRPSALGLRHLNRLLACFAQI